MGRPCAKPIVELIGAAVASYDVLPRNLTGKVESNGDIYHWGVWGVWGECLEPRAGTSVLATYADHFYEGSVAAVKRRLGRGTVTYIGVESFSGDLERKHLRGVFEQAGVAARNLPNDFHVEWRDGFWLATNFTERTVPAPIPAGAKLLLGSKAVPPAGVTVWIE